MKQRSFMGTTFLELTIKERNGFVAEFGGHGSRLGKSNQVFKSPDGRVLFDLTGVKFYLFNNESDYERFIKETEKPNPNIGNLSSATLPIKNIHILEQKEDIIFKFEQKFNVSFNFDKIESLAVLDTLVCNWDRKFFLDESESVIVILSEYLLRNCLRSEVRLMDFGNGTYDILLLSTDPKGIESVGNIYYFEINKLKMDINYRIDLMSEIRSVAEKYK